jgi:hypothetical protein
MPRLRLIALFCSGLVLATSTSAVAQAAPTSARTTSKRVRDGLTGDALGAFDRASTLFEDGDFRGARAEFERAHDLSNEPRILYNVAVCDKMLRKYTRAIESLERSLRDGGKQLPAEYVARTKETMAALAPYVSSVVISADQEGATVLVDGEPVGTTPLAGPLPIEVGEHLVSVRKSGYLDVPKRVRVTGGEVASASFTLETVVTRSELVVEVTGATGSRVMVLIDGVEVGAAPFRTMLEAGPHTIGARAAGLTAAPARIEVKPREPVSLTLRLERESKVGRLRVRADDDADVIELDGREVARGSLEQEIPAGEHHLRVKRSGAEPRALDFVIGENETRSFTLSLEKKGGLPTWFWVGGGLLLTGGATVAIVLLTRKTEYEGSTPGTLAPRVLPAGFAFRGP